MSLVRFNLIFLLKIKVFLLVIMWLSCAFAESEDDPYESINRVVFKFNYTIDKFAFRPITKAYVTITPTPMQKGLHNALNNLGEFKNMANNLLQGEFFSTGKDITRFVLNSTFGLLGLFDVGTPLGLERSNQDFGITLAKWGVGQGPYIMLPLLGPSTVRDGFARLPDTFFSVTAYLHPEHDRYYLALLNGIDARAELLELEKMMQGDPYTFMRTIYLQNRAYKISGEVEDDF